MHRDNKKDISNEVIDYSYVAIMKNKLRVGVIGGGRAGEIKVKHFADGKCFVEILSKTFSPSILELAELYKDNVKLINDDFNFDFLKDKHLIIIAVDDDKLIAHIRKYCDENYKIYVDGSDFTKGNSIIPVQIDKENSIAAVNTKYANPKGTLLVSRKISEVMDEYDEFLGHTAALRKRAKDLKEFKSEILKFIGTEEYRNYYYEGRYKEELYRVFPEEIVKYLIEK